MARADRLGIGEAAGTVHMDRLADGRENGAAYHAAEHVDVGGAVERSVEVGGQLIRAEPQPADPDGVPGKRERHSLELTDRLAELAALLGVVRGQRYRSLGDSDEISAVPQRRSRRRRLGRRDLVDDGGTVQRVAELLGQQDALGAAQSQTKLRTCFQLIIFRRGAEHRGETAAQLLLRRGQLGSHRVTSETSSRSAAETVASIISDVPPAMARPGASLRELMSSSAREPVPKTSRHAQASSATRPVSSLVHHLAEAAAVMASSPWLSRST